MNPSDADKIRTGKPDCPACVGKRLHTTEEWAKFHPDAKKGFVKL